MKDYNTIRLDDIGHATIVLDPDHNILGANFATQKLTKHSLEELIGNKCYKLFHESNCPPCDCPLKKVKNSKQMETSEMTVEILDGKFLVTCTPCFDITGKLEKIVHIAIDITSIKLAEEKSQKRLSENELMLKEVHHRIKNNMNTIAGLMLLQLMDLQEPSAIAALNDARSRILSMMMLYDKLYCSTDFKNISFKEYLSPLVDEIISNFPNKNIVKTQKDIDEFILDSKKMSYIGIIVNELLTNIMKYAFEGRNNGLIAVSAKIKDNNATISIHDNGNTIPEAIDIDSTSCGFGLYLVQMMTRQLAGTMKIERNNGTKFILEFNCKS